MDTTEKIQLVPGQIFDGFLEQGGADSDAGLCGFGIVVLVRNFLT